MTPEYQRAVLMATLASAAVAAAALEVALPRWLAAMVGMYVGVILVYFMDKNKDRFRTDADRILEPNKPALALMGMCVVFGEAVALTVASVASASVAAVAGVMAVIAAGLAWFR